MCFFGVWDGTGHQRANPQHPRPAGLGSDENPGDVRGVGKRGGEDAEVLTAGLVWEV